MLRDVAAVRGCVEETALENVSIPALPDMSSTCVYICDASYDRISSLPSVSVSVKLIVCHVALRRDPSVERE